VLRNLLIAVLVPLKNTPLLPVHQYARTALILASEQGRLAIVQQLIRAGADLNLQDKVSGGVSVSGLQMLLAWCVGEWSNERTYSKNLVMSVP
jgi:ankyrin repeat protein